MFFIIQFILKITWIFLIPWAFLNCVLQRSYKQRGTTFSRNFLVVFIGKAGPLGASYRLPQLNGPIRCYGNSSIIWDSSNSVFPMMLISMVQNLRIQQPWGLFFSFSACSPWYLWSVKQHISLCLILKAFKSTLIFSRSFVWFWFEFRGI